MGVFNSKKGLIVKIIVLVATITTIAILSGKTEVENYKIEVKYPGLLNAPNPEVVEQPKKDNLTQSDEYTLSLEDIKKYIIINKVDNNNWNDIIVIYEDSNTKNYYLDYRSDICINDNILRYTKLFDNLNENYIEFENKLELFLNDNDKKLYYYNKNNDDYCPFDLSYIECIECSLVYYTNSIPIQYINYYTDDHSKTYAYYYDSNRKMVKFDLNDYKSYEQVLRSN